MGEELVPPIPPGLPGPVDPVGDRWRRMQQNALRMMEKGADPDKPLGMEPDEYRARMVAVKLILSRMPRMVELEEGGGRRRIRLRWGSGRMVNMPLHNPGQLEPTEE